MPPEDTDSEDEQPRIDEYGDRFEDYGFLKRAEEHKQAGNAFFQQGRFERALKEYGGALDQLLTVAFDKSIIIGKRKWNDVVIFRSTVHLNKSACHFKLQNWQDSATEALECLHGNLRETLMYSDPHIRAKVRESERKHGGTASGGAGSVEDKLPRLSRAKAWFRLSKCYANLDYLDRAKDAMAKALEMCDDKALLAELSQHGGRIEALERRQKQRQRDQFKGFFEKLQDRGGYVDSKDEVRAKWDSLDYDEKFRRVEELDDSDAEDGALLRLAAATDGRPAPGELAAQRLAQRRTVEVRPSTVGLARARLADISFEEYLERRERGEITYAVEAENQSLHPDGRMDSISVAAGHPGEVGIADAPYDPADIMPQRQEDLARREVEWRARCRGREMDELEEEELRTARERLSRSRQVAGDSRYPRRAGQAKRSVLDDSD